MKPLRLTFFLLAFLSLSSSLRAQDAPAPREVTKLDGTKFFGLVEVTDAYTIRIQSDSGIFNLPIAVLAQKDFQTYKGDSDRSGDGRLWSERRNALEEENKQAGGKNAGIEIQLAEIAPLLPLIAAYESTAGPKTSPSGAMPAASPSPPSGNTDPLPGRNMFSGPGSFNVPTAPFAGGAADLVTSPAATATESLGGVVPTGLTPP